MTVTTEVYYNGDGSTTLFTFPFDYIDQSHVKVGILNVTSGLYEVKAQDDATYGWSLANTTTVEFNTAPPAPTSADPNIKIYRETDSVDPYAIFSPGSPIKAVDLNDNFEQSIYIAQESASVSARAEEVVTEVEALSVQTKAIADQAAADSSAALTTAQAAESTAAIANNTAGNALATANTANDNANTAITDSATAITTANAAADAVSQVVIFDQVANVAAIPASPADADAVSVVDSTGIESFTPLTGVPAGFVGDPGLKVNIIYSGPSLSWTWVSYQPNDPDNRYLNPTDAAELIKRDGSVAMTAALQVDPDATGGINFGGSGGKVVKQGNGIKVLNGGDLTELWRVTPSDMRVSVNANITGNITVSGTVDGRDVAADGIKLDNILTSGENLFANSLNGGQLAGTRNRIINGDMRIDQRHGGNSLTPSNGQYLVDRWRAIQPSGKFSAQRNAGSVAPPPGFTNYLGLTSLSSYSIPSNESFLVKQQVEGYNAADLDWGTASAKPVTLSFWVRSSLTGNFGAVVVWGSSDANERSYPSLYTILSANTWEYKTITIPGDTITTSGGFEVTNGSAVQIRFSLGGGANEAGSAGSWMAGNIQTVTGDTKVVSTNGATLYLTGVQLEAGTVATPFEHKSFGQELALCQRYYYNFNLAFKSDQLNYGGGYRVNHIVPMRATPTLGIQGKQRWTDPVNAIDVGTPTGVNFDGSSKLFSNADPTGFFFTFSKTNRGAWEAVEYQENYSAHAEL